MKTAEGLFCDRCKRKIEKFEYPRVRIFEQVQDHPREMYGHLYRNKTYDLCMDCAKKWNIKVEYDEFWGDNDSEKGQRL